MTQHPIAHQVILIRPATFGFNPETAGSNKFQKAAENADPGAIHEKAMREFSVLAETLENAGVDVLIFDDTHEPHTPDSIFPNNWFSTHSDGTLCLYPMMAENRRLERREDIIETLREKFEIREIVDLTSFENEGKFLEGTGSLVLDHKNRIAYACISPRTDEDALKIWAEKMNFDVVGFAAFDAGGDSDGDAIYHTNVLMCMGDTFAVVCLESIPDAGERKNVQDKLTLTGKEIVEISLRQMADFAGNMLLLQNDSSDRLLIISRQAHGSLDPAQVETLSRHARLVAAEIPTIESCGGGSVRCMIAENFLKTKIATEDTEFTENTKQQLNISNF
ncbi:MAG TPA: arginine deiminase-related protein [Pyrinomonadaceae bacterium]|nr:arginine deiminase-related protein [Pyrinomonadaceae bacterium]